MASKSDLVGRLEKRYEHLMGRREQLLSSLRKAKKELEERKSLAETILQAQTLVQIVAKETQEQLQYKVAGLVTLALQHVFPDPYVFVIRYENKRGRTEASMVVERNGVEIDPLTEAGGGVVDVIAFALRLVMWRLMTRKTRAVFILDEPFRFVSRDLQPRVARMLKDLSEKMHVQMIIVSHEEELIEYADRVYKIERRRGVSEVARDDAQAGEENQEEERPD